MPALRSAVPRPREQQILSRHLAGFAADPDHWLGVRNGNTADRKVAQNWFDRDRRFCYTRRCVRLGRVRSLATCFVHWLHFRSRAWRRTSDASLPPADRSTGRGKIDVCWPTPGAAGRDTVAGSETRFLEPSPRVTFCGCAARDCPGLFGCATCFPSSLNSHR